MAVRDSIYVDVIAETKKSVGSMLKLAAGVGAAVLAFKKIVSIIKDLEATYFVQEQAEAKLRGALIATGTQLTVSQESLQAYASELQQTTLYGDETTISAMALLQSLAKLDEDGLKKITPRVQDFAAAMGVDFVTAMTLVGKTLGSSTNALTRYGVEIDMTGTKEEKLELLTVALTEKFGGMAEQMGSTAFGASVKLKNATGDLKEMFGEIVAEGLQPLREHMTKNITEFVKFRQAVKALNDELDIGGMENFTEQIAAQKRKIDNLNIAITKYRTEMDALAEGSEAWRRHKFSLDQYTASLNDANIMLKVFLLNAKTMDEGEIPTLLDAKYWREFADTIRQGAVVEVANLQRVMEMSGGTIDTTGEQITIFTDALRRLIDEGFVPWDPAIKALIASLKELGEVAEDITTPIHELGPPVNKLAHDMEQASLAQQEFFFGMRDADEAAEAVRALDEEIARLDKDLKEANLAQIFDDLTYSIISMVGEGALDVIGDLGEAMGNAAKGTDDLKKSIGELAQEILDSLPSLLFQTGLAVIKAGNLEVGLSLIAASGLVALGLGVIDQETDDNSASGSNITVNVEGSVITERDITRAITTAQAREYASGY